MLYPRTFYSVRMIYHFQRHVLLDPGGSHVAELVERPMHRFAHTFQTVQRADGRQDMRGVGALRATRHDPPPRFAGGQKRVEQALSRLMSGQPPTKIMQQGEVEPWIREVETERIFPVHAAADPIGGLAIGEPFDGPASPLRAPSARARL
jgi:hypothetical protein